MYLTSKIGALARVIHWRLTWNRRNTHRRYDKVKNPKFMNARQAIRLVQDNDVCAVAGLAGNQRISILSWALRETFEETGHPNNLTLISPGGQGGRGKAPGTLEEWGQEGLISEFICAHHETYRSILHLAANGKVRSHCLPQGILVLLLEAQGEGKDHLISEVGVNTFIDPRTRKESDPETSCIRAEKEGELHCTMPKINIAMFNISSADEEGNLYLDHSALFCEAKAITAAAKQNNGKVIANVGKIIPKDPDKIFIPADQIDAIVYNPNTEQTALFHHRNPADFMTPYGRDDINRGVEVVRFINNVMGVTPKRGAVDDALARIAANFIAEKMPKGSKINIGTGLPEEVSYIFHKEGILDQYETFTEAGALGGVPAPGLFFGAAVGPNEITSSPETFRNTYKKLDATVLGFLEVDEKGNVNASKKLKKHGFVGPGGFMDFTYAAKNIFFIGSWMAGAKYKIQGDELRVLKHGKAKFVSEVTQVTFHGASALQAGKNVYFITQAGIWQLKEDGLVLIYRVPGIQIDKDILAISNGKVIIDNEAPTVSEKVISGKDFSLKSI